VGDVSPSALKLLRQQCFKGVFAGRQVWFESIIIDSPPV
jgi:hypothetical protein